jgi:nucleolar complex protein 3
VLHKLAADKDAAVARLASLSAMLVFKDLAPGYRIRLPTEKELEMAVSKDVQVIRDYETAFLKGALRCRFSVCMPISRPLRQPTKTF